MNPNARELLIRSKISGADPLVDIILSDENSLEHSLYVRATSLRKSPVSCSYLEACLIASDDYERISELMELPVEVVYMYRDIFYDVSRLGRLEKLVLIGEEPAESQLLKTWAITQGLEFISWRMGDVVNISPVDGLQDLWNISYYKSKEAMFSGNADKSSQEAVKWVKMSMDIARLLKTWVMDPNAAKTEIEMALREVNPDFDGFADMEEARVFLEKDPNLSSDQEFDGFEGLNGESD